MTALDYVSMVDENADLINGPEDQDAIAQPLADRLLALDLPGRAKPVLEKLIRSASSDAVKARLGASLAALPEGDDAGTLAVLDASEAAGLPADLAEQRAVAARYRHGAARRPGRRRRGSRRRENRPRRGGAGADPGECRRLARGRAGMDGLRRPDSAG